MNSDGPFAQSIACQHHLTDDLARRPGTLRRPGNRRTDQAQPDQRGPVAFLEGAPGA